MELCRWSWLFFLLALTSFGVRGNVVDFNPDLADHESIDDKSNCALIVSRQGKSQRLDPFSNSKHRRETCITFQSVNAAFSEARDRSLSRLTKSKDLTAPEIDKLGNAIVETTKILAKQYGLSRGSIQNGLPLIDTEKTDINKYCPAYLRFPECEVKRYREFNGLCNNLKNPHWGATLVPFRRLLSPDYANGIDEPRISVTGNELPSPRFVSAFNHPDLGLHDHAVTVFLIAWGQSIDHDMTLTPDTKDPETGKDLSCCDTPVDKRHPACFEIDISAKDPFYSLFRKRCMNFARSTSSLKAECKLGPRSQLNMVTSVLDANFVYGSSKDVADKLRAFKGGLLKSLPVFSKKTLKELLPLKSENPDDGCIRPTPDHFCFMAGDVRVNEQLVLAVVHTIMLREHNRIATELSRINPHWDDETIYQETRIIIAAIVQQITYNEFLPMVLGKDVMRQYELFIQREGFYSGYDPETDPSVPTEFVTAAFRFGHSLLTATIERWSVTHKFIAAQRLSQLLLQPFDLLKPGFVDQYISGLMNQVAQAMDGAVTQEVTNHLFQDPGKRFGLDLAALNIQRGRDHGLPSYNAFRQLCGLGRARDWSDLSGSFPNETLRRYAQTYETPDDIDLWSAGVSEITSPGSLVGPVFGCILGKTFSNLRKGDRFWFENPNWPSSLTLDQINEIRKVKLSRLVCDNSDNIETVQTYVMVLPDPKINPRVSCKSSILPRIDLTKWGDSSARVGHQPRKNPFKKF